MQSGNSPSGDASQPLSADMILETAEWAGLEKNAEWHRRRAMCLRNQKHFEEAQKHFETAMAMDEQNWQAPIGQARIETIRGDHQKALEFFQRASRVLEGLINLEEASSTEMEDLSASHRKVLDLSFRNLDAVVAYLDLILPDDIDEAVRLLKSMEVMVEGQDFTWLTVLLIGSHGQFISIKELYFKVVQAVKSKGEIDWLQNAYRTAISDTRSNRLTTMEFLLNLVLADLFIVYDDKDESALQIWKAVLQFPATLLSWDVLLKYSHNYVGQRYAVHLVQKAFDAGIGTPEAKEHIRSLEDLSVSTDYLMSEIPPSSQLPVTSLATCGAYAGDNDGAAVMTYLGAKILIAAGKDAQAISWLQTFSRSDVYYFYCHGRCGLTRPHWEGG
ncbi:hypothetical protein BDW62DRAFT_204982 [Aspergillus aurantiobrunneus]